MGAIKKIGKFGLGGVIGTVAGVVGGLFMAPDSGNETQKKVRERIGAAKVAGLEAQASKERELIDRFRGNTSNDKALTDAAVESKAKLESKLAEIN